MAVSLHETCLEYFRRRLAEGWKCISLEGYNAVLLSPGGIRRKLDLRNDVETLRPEGNFQVWFDPHGDVTNWECVDELIPDDWTTWAGSDPAQVWQVDLYEIADSGVGAGTIHKVTVYMVVYHNIATRAYRTQIRTGGVTYNGDEKTGLTSDWVEHSQEYANNPGGGAWTWAQINALQAGWSGKWTVETSGNIVCTQIYVEVDYTPAPPYTLENKSANMGSKMIAGNLI